jgi:hypothetical protein
MRRLTAMLTVCLCAFGACRGGAVHEPYDGVLAGAQRPAKHAAAAAPHDPETEPIASEVHVPWTIALLSNAKTSARKKSGRVIVVDSKPAAPPVLVQELNLQAQELDVQLAADPGPDEKPAALKTCSGVVNRRS